jgi:hypothetical protein
VKRRDWRWLTGRLQGLNVKQCDGDVNYLKARRSFESHDLKGQKIEIEMKEIMRKVMKSQDYDHSNETELVERFCLEIQEKSSILFLVGTVQK